MIRKLLLTLLVLSGMLHAFSQARLGQVATVYVTSSNLDSSVADYSKLGFNKIASNEFPSPWAQVSDGSLLIMIRRDATPYMGLTYYSSDVETIVAGLEKDGQVFLQKPGASDPIKRYVLKTAEGFPIVLSNNLGGFQQPNGKTLLNMKPADYTNPASYPNSSCGVFGEYALPVKDVKTSIAFWQKLGFTLKAEMNAPYPHAILSDGLMIIGLHQTEQFTYPAVTYFGIQTDQRIEAIRKSGLNRFSPMAGHSQVLTTWEGQHFFIFPLGM